MRGTSSTLAAPRRRGFWSIARHLYVTDAAFRSCVDFAVLGTIVVMFVAPSTLTEIGEALSANWWTPSNATSSTTSVAPPTSANLQDQAQQLAQAAKSAPSSKVKPLRDPIDRRWFTLSPEPLRSDLETGADLLEGGQPALALDHFDRLGQPKDPNVLFMSGLAHVVEGGKQNVIAAFSLYKEAAAAGQPAAMFEVAQFYRLGAVGPPDPAEALAWYERADEAGHPEAPGQIGRYYYYGWAGLPVSPSRAVEYYRKGAERGDAWGASNLGAAYYNGQGLPRDYDKARFWLEQAVAKNLPEAMFDLAHMHLEGQGGPIDIPRFLELNEKAAGAGHVRALHELGMFFLNPADGRAADPVKAATYLRQAAVRNYGPSQFAFATLYEKGIGVKENLVQAYVYYALALRNGQPEARPRLNDLDQRMTATDIERAKGLLAVAGGSG